MAKSIRGRVGAAGLLVLTLLCQGCAGDGEYYRETPHAAAAAGETRFRGDVSVNNYYALQSAVIGMIGNSRETNTIPISSDYEGSLEEDLARVTQEITTENPLGCFAVASIVFDQTRVLTYQELTITIRYKRLSKEIAAVQECPSLRIFESRLSELLSGFGDQGFYSISGLEEGEEDLYDRAMRCWYSAADAAYGLRDIAILTYPETGAKRIVEVQVQWTASRQELLAQGEEARRQAKQICHQFQGETLEEKLEFVRQYLAESVEYDDAAMRVVAETGGRQAKTSFYTAYGALAEGRAAQSGMAHAAKLLLDELDVNCSLVWGRRQGVSCLWLRVQSEGQNCHYDPTGSYGLMDSQQAEQNGYEYNAAAYSFD